jgi:hypothetical protein
VTTTSAGGWTTRLGTLADGTIVTAYYAAESRGFWAGSLGWHAGPGALGPHCAVVKYRPEDLPFEGSAA